MINFPFLAVFATLALSVNAVSYLKMPYNTPEWPEIRKRLGELEQQINTGRSPTYEVKYAIKMFDPYTADYNYDSLYRVESDPSWKTRMEKVLPKMAKIALRLPELLPNPGVRVLKKGENGVVRLNQLQILSLMANSFFCTLPGKEENFPRNKFCTLFQGGGGEETKAEKLKTILHYFERMLENYPNVSTGTWVTYERRALRDWEVPNWYSSTKPLKGVWVVDDAVIEDEEGFQHLQADFANKMLGGGILGNGATQEEIRFVICPELIISSILFEELDDNEAAIITGVERFSSTRGYAGSLKYAGDYKDSTPLDSQGRRDTSVFAIDALKFYDGEEWKQFRAWEVDRELKKAFAAFSKNGRVEDWKDIATGNWGSGVFNGDQDLKFIIQWMAASEAGRDMKYFTKGRAGQKEDIIRILKHIKSKPGNIVTVGKMYKAINLYRTKVVDKHDQNKISIFKFILEDGDCQRILGL